jgi:hypothetical protein
MMLPFFLIGIAIPVYFFGFNGDGPPKMEPAADSSYSPSTVPSDGSRSFAPEAPPSEVVGVFRNSFDGIVDQYVSPNLSPLTIKLGTLAALFIAGFVVLRLILAVVTGALGSFFGFLVHKAAGPMFMGFLAVGSTWGIHQTIAQQFGLTWAAMTVSLTAAIAALFALAGVRIRG